MLESARNSMEVNSKECKPNSYTRIEELKSDSEEEYKCNNEKATNIDKKTYIDATIQYIKFLQINFF